VKCFKCLGMRHYAYECPTKKTILKDNGECTSHSNDSDKEEEESDGELKANE